REMRDERRPHAGICYRRYRRRDHHDPGGERIPHEAMVAAAPGGRLPQRHLLRGKGATGRSYCRGDLEPRRTAHHRNTAMTAMAVGWHLPPVVSLLELGPPAAALSRDDGESLGIYRLHAHPGWLAKIYKSPQDAEQAADLDQLIALPQNAPTGDRDVIRSHASWPVARVIDQQGRGVGCVLPEAPVTY